MAHPGEVWYRNSYEITAPIRKINIVKNMKKNTIDGAKHWVEREPWADYFDDEDIKALSTFTKYDAPLELEAALIKDLHKLCMLGLPHSKRFTFPAPAECACKYCHPPVEVQI